MREPWETVWRFETAKYSVALSVQQCWETPDWCDDEEVAEIMRDIENGRAVYFNARVQVFKAGVEVGADYLSACHYKTLEEFYTGHRDPDPMNRNCSIMRAAKGENVVICHYFPSMVHEAIKNARETLAKLAA